MTPLGAPSSVELRMTMAVCSSYYPVAKGQELVCLERARGGERSELFGSLVGWAATSG